MLFSGMLYLQTANCTSCWAGAKARKKLGFDGPVGARPRDKLRIFIFFISPSILQKYMVHKFFCKTIHLAPWRTPCPPRYVPTRRKTKLAIGATDWTEPRARERSLPGASFFLYSFLFNKFFSYIIYVYNLPLHKKLCAQLIIYRKIMYTTCR
jgi:hypothetical protein